MEKVEKQIILCGIILIIVVGIISCILVYDNLQDDKFCEEIGWEGSTIYISSPHRCYRYINHTSGIGHNKEYSGYIYK